MAHEVVAAEGGPDWNEVADRFCRAWTTGTGKPDFYVLADMYAPDPDIIIYDSLPPIEGFRGFDDLRSSIYDGLDRLTVERTGPVEVRSLVGGAAVITAYPMRFAYDFSDGRKHRFDARITEVWERRGDRYVIVHEHPSTVL